MFPTRARPLADLVGPVLGPALAAQGFSGADLVQSWAEIVGERFARVTRPIRIEWPRRRVEAGGGPAPATLVLGVEGAFALEMQHLAPVLTERINAVYGWRCIGRIVLKQGPVRRPRPAAARPARALLPEEEQGIREAVASVADVGLRCALDRLGRAVARNGGRDAAP